MIFLKNRLEVFLVIQKVKFSKYEFLFPRGKEDVPIEQSGEGNEFSDHVNGLKEEVCSLKGGSFQIYTEVDEWSLKGSAFKAKLL